MACMVNTSSNTNDKKNGTQLHLQRKNNNNTMRTSHTYKENDRSKKSVQVVSQFRKRIRNKPLNQFVIRQ